MRPAIILFVFFSFSSSAFADDSSICTEILQEVEENEEHYFLIDTTKKRVVMQLAKNFEKEAEDILRTMQKNYTSGNPEHWLKKMNESLQKRNCLVQAAENME